MDIRYTNALRNASAAWSKNQAADAMTMQDLQKRVPVPHAQTLAVTAPNAAQMGVLQPELARYGNLGTKLNLFA
ncbi:MAG: hypothetical protein KBT18_15020 [Comamonas sp.]|nr:hypothetical protein [Candidatus Comamonas equi]